jgi:hypothetical protein
MIITQKKDLKRGNAKKHKKKYVFSAIRKVNTENTMIINNLSGEKLDIIMVFVADSWFYLQTQQKAIILNVRTPLS